MKTVLIFILAGLLLVPGTINAQSSRKELKKQREQEEFMGMQTFIDSVNFTFKAERATPTGGRTIDLSTHTSYLTISGDSIDVYLPFFGQAYNVGYSNNTGGFKFLAPITDFRKEINEKKKNINISFSVRYEGDSMDFSLSTFGSGSASLTIVSMNRKPISYSGQIKKNSE